MSAPLPIVRLAVLAVMVSLSLTLPRTAHAQAAHGQSVPVLAIDSDDADEQADALTTALRSHIRQTPGWTLLETNQSLSMLTAAFQCPQHPDAPCLTRIGDKLKADQFFWGVLSKAPGHQVSAELHLWSKGKPDKVARASYSDNMKDANDDGLKRIATNLFATVLGAATGTINIHANADSGTVLVDGVASGTLVGGRSTLSLLSGPHSLEVQAPGFSPAKRQVTIDPAVPGQLEFSLDAAPGGAPAPAEATRPLPVRKIAGWSTLGAGAILIGVGIGFGIADLNDISNLNSARNNNYLTGSKTAVQDPCNPPTSPTPNTIEGCNAVSASHTAVAVEITTLAVGGVAAGVGLFLLLTDHSSSESSAPAPAPASDKTGISSLRLLPAVAPGSASMLVLGRF